MILAQVNSAEIAGDQITVRTLIARGTKVPQVHWAFWGSGEGESGFGASLTRRNLSSLLNARNAENSEFARVRYRAGTRNQHRQVSSPKARSRRETSKPLSSLFSSQRGDRFQHCGSPGGQVTGQDTGQQQHDKARHSGNGILWLNSKQHALRHMGTNKGQRQSN
jgi:hypothetical protein